MTRRCINISVGIIIILLLLLSRRSDSDDRIRKHDFFDFSVFAGVFLLEQERYPEASAQLVEAVALEPDDYDLIVTAATALRQSGLSHRAEDMYRKAATIRPQVRTKYFVLFIS